MRKFEGNLIRRIREATGKNQTDFGLMFGRTLPSVQSYERGAIPPRDVIEKLKVIAAEAGADHLAALFATEGWNVKRPIETGEKLTPTPVISRPAAHADAAPHDPHGALDAILDSGQDDAIEAVLKNLHCFEALVRIRKGRDRVVKKVARKGRKGA